MCACKAISVLTKCGMEAFNLGSPKEAAHKINQAIDLAKSVGSAVNEAKLRKNLALVYSASGDAGKALDELKLALKLVNARVGCQNKLYAKISNEIEILERLAA